MELCVIDLSVLRGIGDAVRTKEGSSESIPVNSLKQRILDIQTAPDLPGLTVGTATASDILSGKKAWVNGEEITGEIACYDLENNNVEWRLTSMSPTGGEALMVVDLETGYYEAGSYDVGSLPVYVPNNITPGTSDVTVPGGAWFTSNFKVLGDSNLKSSNIRSGVSIFGIPGTLVEQEDLSVELSTQQSLISQIEAALANKAAAG